MIGNVLSRGNPAVEHVLESRLPYFSGPQWLYNEVLAKRKVIAVSGTHGKTTTTAMLAWILEVAELNPSFLIGGAPSNFVSSTRLTDSEWFVIEADEYDSAFFDKRPKFMHYHPDVLIMNNIEFDHADIYENIEQIQRQYHYLLRTVPTNGALVFNADDAHIENVLASGVWSRCSSFGLQCGQLRAQNISTTAEQFDVYLEDEMQGAVRWSLCGQHNVANALAALSAAMQIGLPLTKSIEALSTFRGVQKRFEVIDEVNGVTFYEDFAHHPTSINMTLQALRSKVADKRIVAMLEMGSRTMQRAVDPQILADSLSQADHVILLNAENIQWDIDELLGELPDKLWIMDSIDEILTEIPAFLQKQDHVILLSNKSFNGLTRRLMATLSEQQEVTTW